jgi:hypothetical protein
VLGLSGILGVAPLRIWGLTGNKSTPSVGWKVSVRSNLLASRRWTKHVRDNNFGDFTFV